MPRKRNWVWNSKQRKKAGYLQSVALDLKLLGAGPEQGTSGSRVQRSDHSTTLEVLIVPDAYCSSTNQRLQISITGKKQTCILKLKCKAKTTLRHLIVWDRCGTMPKFQWKNRLTFRYIYVQSWQNHSFPIIFRKHSQGLASSCDVTHDTGVPSCRSRPACTKMSVNESDAALRWSSTFCCMSTKPFDCVWQFGNVRCDVTSENSRQMYESTPFCLVNNKVLDLGKYCPF